MNYIQVKDVFNYSRVLDIKGSRMKLDDNPPVKFQAKPQCEKPYQHCLFGNSNKIHFKPQKTLKVAHIMKNRKPKEKAVPIERCVFKGPE